MIVTEEQAKTKWCPFARQAVCLSHDIPAGATSNRDGNEHYGAANVSCLGSACMAWQAHESPGFKNIAEAEFRKTGRRLKSDEGYCGLAGTPS